MWEWTLSWSQVRDDLFIGTCPMTAEDIDRIHADTGATALLSLQTEDCRRPFGVDWEELRGHGEHINLAMVNAPMRDFDSTDQRRNLPHAVRSLHDLLDSDHVVYMHDTSSINRAPLTALGYMTFVEMHRPDDAFGEILSKHPHSAPSWEAYEGCRHDLLDILRENIVVRAYYLSQEESDRNSEQHWLQAEREMIRISFISTQSPLHQRLDPSRDVLSPAS